MTTETKRPAHRPVTHTDEQIMDAIASGATNVTTLLDNLGLRHKTTLIKRLRHLEAQGRVTIYDHRGPYGFELGVRYNPPSANSQ